MARVLELALRRLDRRQLRLVVDALRERKVVMGLAPHLARPLRLLTPLFRPLEVPYYWTGLRLYDLLAGGRRLGASRYASPREVRALFPDLPPTLGGVLYWDGQFLDYRLNLALVLSALARGAVALNHAEATGFLLRGGRVQGAVVRDRLGGRLPGFEAYFAGPPPMVQAMQRMLCEAGVPMDHLHFDEFL